MSPGPSSRWFQARSAASSPPPAAEARERLGQVVDQLRPHAPKVAALLEDAEADLLAFYAFPAEHWSKLRSTNPLERVNREIGRRSDVVGIFPNDAALLRLAGMLLLEQNDEWLVGRRYLSESSMALVLAKPGHNQPRSQGGPPAHRITTAVNPPTIRSYTTRCDLTRLALHSPASSPNHWGAPLQSFSRSFHQAATAAEPDRTHRNPRPT